MSDAFRVEVSGLRDAQGRFAREADALIQERQDQLLTGLATQLRQRLQESAPRGHTTPHLADMFRVGPLQRDGSNASIAVSNTKQVHSKAGRSWFLIQLLTQGTGPHAIPGAFGYPLPFGTDPHFHPGTRPNPFVERALSQLDVRTALMTTARGVVADLGGRAL